MFNRLPALAAGAALTALVGGGIAYATADNATPDSDRAAGPRMTTKTQDYYGVVQDTSDDGQWQVIGGTGRCPRGTQVTGGGFYDATTDGITWTSDPDWDGKEGWTALTIASSGQDDEAFIISVTCYGPAGKFPNWAYRDGTTPKAARPSADLLSKGKERLAAR